MPQVCQFTGVSVNLSNPSTREDLPDSCPVFVSVTGLAISTLLHNMKYAYPLIESRNQELTLIPKTLNWHVNR